MRRPRGGDHSFNVARDFRSSSAEPIDNTLRRDAVPAVDVNELIREHRATVVLLDIEGSEYTLVPRCDITTLRAFVVELHRASERDPQVLGLFKFFVDRGFVVDLIVDFNLFIFRRAA